jgi:hypothetical protein
MGPRMRGPFRSVRLELCTEHERPWPDAEDYFGASGHRPVIGPKASSPLITLTTL